MRDRLGGVLVLGGAHAHEVAAAVGRQAGAPVDGDAVGAQGQRLTVDDLGAEADLPEGVVVALPLGHLAGQADDGAGVLDVLVGQLVEPDRAALRGHAQGADAGALGLGRGLLVERDRGQLVVDRVGPHAEDEGEDAEEDGETAEDATHGGLLLRERQQ
nr:hypothetical protein [Arsenicicoccus bolidensis]